mgnify:CR=1 FL=1
MRNITFNIISLIHREKNWLCDYISEVGNLGFQIDQLVRWVSDMSQAVLSLGVV